MFSSNAMWHSGDIMEINTASWCGFMSVSTRAVVKWCQLFLFQCVFPSSITYMKMLTIFWQCQCMVKHQTLLCISERHKTDKYCFCYKGTDHLRWYHVVSTSHVESVVMMILKSELCNVAEGLQEMLYCSCRWVLMGLCVELTHWLLGDLN